MLLVMPRLVGRAKRLPVPDELAGLDVAPRHLSLLSYLLLDGPVAVNDLADRLEVAPTTVSLIVSDLSRAGIVERHEDSGDRRRRLVAITAPLRPAVERWLAGSARAWRAALEPLSAAERTAVVRTLQRLEDELSRQVGRD